MAPVSSLCLVLDLVTVQGGPTGLGPDFEVLCIYSVFRSCSWADLDFECSTVCPILLGLMGMCQKRLQDGGTAQIKVNPTQVRQEMGHPVQSKRELWSPRRKSGQQILRILRMNNDESFLAEP